MFELLLNYQVHSIGLSPYHTKDASRLRSGKLRATPATRSLLAAATANSRQRSSGGVLSPKLQRSVKLTGNESHINYETLKSILIHLIERIY